MHPRSLAIALAGAVLLTALAAAPALAADGPKVGGMKQCADAGQGNKTLFTSTDCESARQAIAKLRTLGAKRASAQGVHCFWRNGEKSVVFCTLPAKKAQGDGPQTRYNEMSANSNLGGGAFASW
jgi:hypothetical protein